MLEILFNYYFNWIKFKTLPPSLLFRNRLYIERDSKHRRVMVNLGLTFRNSKWSSYGRKNISLQFVHKYLRSLFLLVLVVLLAFFFNPTNIVDNLWGALDTTLSNLLFGYFFLLATIHTLVNNAYSFFAAKVFKTNDSTPKFTNASRKPIGKTPLTSKTSEQLLVYNWLKQPSSQPALFEVFGKSQKDLTPKISLTQNLFKLTQSLNLVKHQNFDTGSFTPTSTNSLVPTKFTSQSLTIDLMRDQYSTKNQYNTLSKRFKWSLDHLDTTDQQLTSAFFAKSGVFYVPSLNVSQLNAATSQYKEMLITPEILSSQKALIQRNAWLYKFSTLNRGSLNYAKNLTRTKSFLNGGTLPFNLESKNIWASNELNINEKLPNLKRSLAAGKTMWDPQNQPFMYNNSNLSNLHVDFTLKSSESSYFWLIKRFYFFNGLQTNQSVLAAQPQKINTTNLLTSTEGLQPTLKIFATQLLSNPTLTSDLKSAFYTANTTVNHSTFSSESATPVMLNYVNTGMYTTSFATLVTTFGSNLSYNSRNSYYNPLCTGQGSKYSNVVTVLDGLSPTAQPVKFSLTNNSLELTRDATYLADLKLLTLFFF